MIVCILASPTYLLRLGWDRKRSCCAIHCMKRHHTELSILWPTGVSLGLRVLQIFSWLIRSNATLGIRWPAPEWYGAWQYGPHRIFRPRIQLAASRESHRSSIRYCEINDAPVDRISRGHCSMLCFQVQLNLTIWVEFENWWRHCFGNFYLSVWSC